MLFSCSSTEQKNIEKKADLFYRHGTMKLVQKEYTDALNYLLKANTLRPNDSQINNNLAMAYYFKEDFKKAKHHLLLSLKLDTTNSDARNNLASIYFKEGKIKQAEKQYLKISKNLIYKQQFRTYYNLAHVEVKKQNNIKALSYLKKSLQEKNDYCPAHFLKGTIYKNKRKYKMALNAFKKATMGTCVQMPSPHFEQAKIYLRLDRINDARKKLKFIVEQFPNQEISKIARKKINEINKTFKFRSNLLKDDIIGIELESKKIESNYTGQNF